MIQDDSVDPVAGGTKVKPKHASRGWELFAHGADIGVRGYGKTREAAFEEAANALCGVVSNTRHVRRSTSMDFVCNAPTDDRLLHQWLNAVIRVMTARNMIFGRFSVQIHSHGLTARGWGEEVDVDRHQPAARIREATTTELHVSRDDRGRWSAQCVIDL